MHGDRMDAVDHDDWAVWLGNNFKVFLVCFYKNVVYLLRPQHQKGCVAWLVIYVPAHASGVYHDQSPNTHVGYVIAMDPKGIDIQPWLSCYEMTGFD